MMCEKVNEGRPSGQLPWLAAPAVPYRTGRRHRTGGDVAHGEPDGNGKTRRTRTRTVWSLLWRGPRNDRVSRKSTLSYLKTYLR